MKQTKSIFVSIIGKPNVGKSSLLNFFLGQKISIVSSKPQTTRTKIKGIVTEDNIQIVFFDTPGVHKSKNKLDNNMYSKIKESIVDVDLNLLVVDSYSKLNENEYNLIKSLKNKNVILVINKIDKLKNKNEVLLKIDEYKDLLNFIAIVPISVNNGQGINVLKDEIKKLAYDSPHFFDRYDLTDQTEKFIISEIIREKILIYTHNEIPHGVFVEIESMKKRKDCELFDINSVIYCEKSTHKSIIIGKNGNMLKRIASSARIDCENLISSKINLKCFVKVKEDWRNISRFVNNESIFY